MDQNKPTDNSSADEEFMDATDMGADSTVKNLSAGLSKLSTSRSTSSGRLSPPSPPGRGRLSPPSPPAIYTRLGIPQRIQKTEWEKIVFFGDAVPQILPLSADQVQNNAGGFVYAVSDRVRIRRFLILGTNGGTYYAKEQTLTLENLSDLMEIIRKGNGKEILHELYEIDRANRAPKHTPLIFCLALVAHYNFDVPAAEKTLKSNCDYARRLAYKLFPKICRIPTHVFEFAEFSEKVGEFSAKVGGGTSTGWGRGQRNAISDWYMNRDVMPLAVALTKYQQRNGWSHRDLLRLAHPHPREENQGHNDLFLYATKGYDKLLERCQEHVDSDAAPVQAEASGDKPIPAASKSLKANAPNYLKFLQAVEIMKQCADENTAVKLIAEFGLVREHVSTELIRNNKTVWSALLKKMPMTALIRNLGKMSTIEMFSEGSENTKLAISKLTDQNALRQARIHPLNVLLALSVYRAGKGDKGKLKWTANKEIVSALNDAFYKTFANVLPTNKRFLLALDVSGSMCSSMSGTALSCREASGAMAMVTLRTEPTCEVVAFQDQLTELNLQKTMTLDEVVKGVSNLAFGNTDCALPMLWAAERQKKFDCFVVYTDNETYFGDVHPAEAMRLYRQKSGIWDAKLIVCGMTATKFTIADPNDPFMLDVVGFDSSAPELIRNFVMGWDSAPTVVNLEMELVQRQTDQQQQMDQD